MSDETQTAFKRFAGMAYLYFGRDVNSVPPDTLSLWMKEVGNYPAEFFSWALEHVKSLDSGRTVIANLPKAVKELWAQWLRANPDKHERREFSGCKNPLCEDGRFWVYEQNHETSELTRRIAICAECRRVGQGMTAGMSRYQAERAGYLLPNDDLDARYSEQQEEKTAKDWARFADVRAPRFVREAS